MSEMSTLFRKAAEIMRQLGYTKGNLLRLRDSAKMMGNVPLQPGDFEGCCALGALVLAELGFGKSFDQLYNPGYRDRASVAVFADCVRKHIGPDDYQKQDVLQVHVWSDSLAPSPLIADMTKYFEAVKEAEKAATEIVAKEFEACADAIEQKAAQP